MFKGWWHVRAEDERQQWTQDPFVSVGPLRFGMSAAEVADTMSGVTQDGGDRRVTGPEDTWVVSQCRYREFGLELFYRERRLSAVVVDALRGPQVIADGMALVGRVPSELEQWMWERADSLPPETELAFMSAGVPCSESLGVTINVQRAGDRLLTRPIFYPAEALHDLPHWLPQEAWAIHG
ncbi:hypothetical protein ACFYUY_23705 [Kitasatospora sp. NPDC004745]|uniref:hypothetical protein n=1 Tax=Kitasatospora sp. NPDC004745 TaxID=3364019 RepID=UPI0036B6441A